MKNFAHGFTLVFKGIGFSFAQKKIRFILFLSGFINFVLFGLCLYFLSRRVSDYLHMRLTSPEVWYQYVWVAVVFVVSYLLITGLSAIIVYLISSILMIGWGDLLSRQTLKAKNIPLKNYGFWHSLKKVPTLVLKSLLLLLFATFGILISFIPGLGLLSFFVNSIVISFDMMDYGFDHLGLTLQERFTFLTSNLSTILGFATAQGLLFFIPVLNVFCFQVLLWPQACLLPK
jgi:uncharacterized protein involved in cysteine biosynthesis